MAAIRTFYDELGVGRDAGRSEIKRAFKDIAKRYHPDRNPPEKQKWAHEQMSRLNFIVETLLNAKTRAEYNELVVKYERLAAQPRRTERQEYALHREYAQVSVEIMNLSGKYFNCRLKMLIGGGVSITALVAVVVLSSFSDGSDIAEFYLAFGRFIVLVGAIMAAIGLSDYLGRGHYQKRIDELESRRFTLRRRMYEAWTGY
jgi:curved DNA-binding protein CbpA